jgi:hypothetical protein
MSYKHPHSVIPKTSTTIVDIGEKAKSYATWLTTDNERNTLSSNREKTNKVTTQVVWNEGRMG